MPARNHEPPPRRESPKPEALQLPPLREYSQGIAQAVADSRGLNITAVEFAYHWLKTVVFAKVCEEPSWILTDGSNRSAEARRIDRKPYPAIGTLGERKSHHLRGSSKSLASWYPARLVLRNRGSRSIATRFFSLKAGQTTSPPASLSQSKTRMFFPSRCSARAQPFARTRSLTSPIGA